MSQHPLIALWLQTTNGAGEPARPRRLAAPPYLCDRVWKHLCECGYTWRTTSDAVWREEMWTGPRRECVNCHAWVDGRPDH